MQGANGGGRDRHRRGLICRKYPLASCGKRAAARQVTNGLSGGTAPEEASRFGKKRSFFAALARLPKFKVREGRTVRRQTVAGHDTFHQKGVDLMIGLDVAKLSLRHKITHAAIFSGDSDLLPAVSLAQEEGVVVWHLHGPADTYANVLWDAADNRLSVDAEFMDAVARPRRVS